MTTKVEEVGLAHYCKCGKFPVRNRGADSGKIYPWPSIRHFEKIKELGSSAAVGRWLVREIGAIAEWKGAMGKFADHLFNECGLAEDSLDA